MGTRPRCRQSTPCHAPAGPVLRFVCSQSVQRLACISPKAMLSLLALSHWCDVTVRWPDKGENSSASKADLKLSSLPTFLARS
eukprot:scaffold122674_cov16-Prasinocladus_malaysianus.AAC.1